MRRDIHISWAGRILLRGCCVVERQFTETVNNAEESGTIASKIGGRFCAANGGVNLGGRGGKKSKTRFQIMGGRNDVSHRSVGLMVVGGNSSGKIMSVSEIMARRRAGLCLCMRESTINILLILTPRKYYCSIFA